ncbi:translation initiation factor Sui1 [Desulfohalobium retbaense]|uniref:Translation initiation factor SUI1 n=1 Tax=Desulfohalobium retbaense (strain ATCC 49708 / DSM 5692 / JCM 16813 / HR100) TaxID=485915 RepID=C8X2T3_DESRD|nr:translation initiation factor Sui1 [Desulfohalobium retbaense]ACV68730.1 translation initiation factor SUI1 [Desulfohalobium retbaense DSM 5692]
MAPKKPHNSRAVYSTDDGRLCPQCGQSAARCVCHKNKKGSAAATESDGIVRLKRESKGRKGKGVTLITGVPLEAEALKQLAKTLKQKCGTGGTVKNGVIEIQGEHRDILAQQLRAQGYTVKIAGG